MRELRERIEAVARTRAAVLLVGETGTGKGALARVLHACSPFRARPFVHLDCATVAQGLVESSLFGHERGAFTGAHARHVGRLEAAADGTLFLDEIAELERTAQARLLRVLQDRTFERVGGGATLCMRARVVAATNRDLAEAVSQGRFREDLFHRLAVVALRVPSVRERVRDLPALLAHAARRSRAAHRGPEVRFAASGLRVLAAHRWPGNVREIMNAVERASACWPGRVVDAALAVRLLDAGRVRPSGLASAACVGDARCSDHRTGARALAAILARCDGNVSAAARALGVPRSTLRYRLRAAGLSRVAVGAETGSAQLALPGVLAGAACPRPSGSSTPDDPRQSQAATTSRSATSVSTAL